MVLVFSVLNYSITDDYGMKIIQGRSYISGHFLEQLHYTNKSTVFNIEKKRVTCCYKETVVYLYVDINEKGDHVELTNSIETENLLCLEQTGYGHI